MGSNRNRTVSERSVTPPITRGSAVALCRPLRMLRPRPLRGIRWPRPTRRTRRSTAGSPAPQRPARSVPTDVLDEGMPGDDHFGVTVLLEAAHRRNRAFSLPWSHSTCLLASRSVRCQVAGSSCSTTAGSTGALSVVTSAGVTLVAPIASGLDLEPVDEVRGDAGVGDRASFAGWLVGERHHLQ